MFIGYLLPTIVMLRQKLVAKIVAAALCKPIITALLDGIDRRYQELYSDVDAIAAAIIYPRFKLAWTDDRSMIDTGLQHIKNIQTTSTSMTSVIDGVDVDGESGSSDLDDEDSFFTRRKASVSDNDVLMQHAQARTDDMAIIIYSRTLKKLFI